MACHAENSPHPQRVNSISWPIHGISRSIHTEDRAADSMSVGVTDGMLHSAHANEKHGTHGILLQASFPLRYSSYDDGDDGHTDGRIDVAGLMRD